MAQNKYLQLLRNSAYAEGYDAAVAMITANAPKLDGAPIVVRFTETEGDATVTRALLGVAYGEAGNVSYVELGGERIKDVKAALTQAIADAVAVETERATKVEEALGKRIDETNAAIESKNVGAEGETGDSALVTASATGNKVTVGTTEKLQDAVALAETALQAENIATGSANGTISVKGNDVAVKGLGSAAYTDSTAYDAAGAAAAVKTAIEGELAETDAKTLAALNDRIDEVSGAAKTYEIVAVTEGLGENVKEAFKLVDEDGTQAGATINIYKDSSLKEVELVEQELKFTYILANGSESTVGVDVSKFLAESEFGDGLKVTDGVVSVEVDATSESFLTVGENGVKLSGVQDAINNAVAAKNVSAEGDTYVTATATGNKVTVAASESTKASLALADSAVQEVKEGTTNGTISVDGTEVSVHGLGSAAYTNSTAYDAAGTAQGLINELDATVSNTPVEGDIVKVEVVQENGVITAVNVTEGDTWDCGTF